MKLTCSSIARLLIPCWILLLAASLYYGSQWKNEAALLMRQRIALKGKQGRMNEVLARLLTLPSEVERDSTASLDQEVADVILAIMQNRVACAVRIDQVENLAFVHPVNNLDDFDDLERPIPDTREKVEGTIIQVKGQYSAYPGFRAFLKALHAYPVAITELDEQGRVFEMKLEVFGRQGEANDS